MSRSSFQTIWFIESLVPSIRVNRRCRSSTRQHLKLSILINCDLTWTIKRSIRLEMLFLSHSGQDTEDAKSLASLLREAGVEVWLDVERLQPGNRWMEELEKALRVANSFAVYVGKSGVQRWVDREVRIALERNTENPNFRVFPILGPGANLNA